jgi:hypothetical protein
MSVIPKWVIALVVVVLIIFLLNALHLIAIHGSVGV